LSDIEKEAYERGKRDGSMVSVSLSVDRAHTRIDKHDVRVTALEKVMYAGMGIFLFIQLMPALKVLSGGF
jgi:hypothetical protein